MRCIQMTKYWLWVTTRETAYNSDLANHENEAWTCDESTKEGDLIFLYLNSKGRPVRGYPKSTFRYLMQAKSDAYDGEHYPGWRENGWKWACESRVLYTFMNPVTFRDLKIRNLEFEKWEAYKRRNFQGRSFKIPEDIWIKLDYIASEKDPEYPGYQNLIGRPHSVIESVVDADLDSISAEEELFEGRRVQRYTNHYERNPRLRSKAIELHGFRCMVCGFDFEETYGEHGSNFIEVHHLNPVSSLEDETRVDPETEMTVVCSNCHRMIHRKKDDVLSLEDLRRLIQKTDDNS